MNLNISNINDTLGHHAGLFHIQLKPISILCELWARAMEPSLRFANLFPISRFTFFWAVSHVYHWSTRPPSGNYTARANPAVPVCVFSKVNAFWRNGSISIELVGWRMENGYSGLDHQFHFPLLYSFSKAKVRNYRTWHHEARREWQADDMKTSNLEKVPRGLRRGGHRGSRTVFLGWAWSATLSEHGRPHVCYPCMANASQFLYGKTFVIWMIWISGNYSMHIYCQTAKSVDRWVQNHT